MGTCTCGTHTLRRALRAGDRQQPVVFVLDHAIAAARACFQGPAVLHRECAAAATDDAGLTQPAGGFGDAFAPHAKQPRREFLRQRHLVVLHPVQAHQEQTAKLLLDRVMAIAHHDLGNLRDQGLRIAQQMAHEAAAPLELFDQAVAVQRQAVTRAMHHAAGGRRVTAHE